MPMSDMPTHAKSFADIEISPDQPMRFVSSFIFTYSHCTNLGTLHSFNSAVISQSILITASDALDHMNKAFKGLIGKKCKKELFKVIKSLNND